MSFFTTYILTKWSVSTPPFGQDYIKTKINAVGNTEKIERVATEWQEDNLISQEFWSHCYYSPTIQFPWIGRNGSQFRRDVLKSALPTSASSSKLKVSENLFYARGSLCAVYKTNVNWGSHGSGTLCPFISVFESI